MSDPLSAFWVGFGFTLGVIVAILLTAAVANWSLGDE